MMRNFTQLKLLGVLLLLVCSIGQISAKTVSVKGRVLDQNGQGLLGAVVLEQGTSNGTQVGADGSYVIDVDSEGALTFQFMGFATQVVSVQNRTTIDVTLAEQVDELEEVVVMAYGVKKKRDVIGSVAKVSSDDLKTVAGGNFQNALQGRAAGVQVVGGSLGSDPQIKIRGVSSISSGTDPLWVVDGVIGSSDIPMADIESIEILKDASATAIYGSRGSNGVIIVTTKQAEKGEIKVNANYQYGITSLTNTDIGMASTQEYFEFMDAAKANRGLTHFDPQTDIMDDWTDADETITREQALNTNTDHLDTVSRMGNFQDAYVSISGGGENLSLLTSLNYRDEEYVYEGYDKSKLIGRMNAVYQKGSVKIGAELKGNFSNTSNISDWGAFDAFPWMPYYSDESDSGYWNARESNSMAMLDSSLRQNETKGMGGHLFGYLEYASPHIEGLSLRVDAKINGSLTQNNEWTSKVISVPSDGNTATRAKVSSTGEQYHALLKYDKTVGDHAFSALAGLEYRRSIADDLSLGGRNIIGEFQEIANIPSGYYDAANTYGVLENENYLFNYLTRLDYKYKNRYLLGASFVREGSSKFTEENRWGNFYSLSAGWIISDEEFLKNVDWLSILKLRGSMGQTGNQNIASEATMKVYSTQSNKVYNYGTATFMTSIPNKAVTWETTSSIDVGIDFGFFKNRLMGSVAYYRQNVDDMLTQMELPVSAGIPNQGLGLNNTMWANIGSMYNQGFEVDLTYRAVMRNDFSWNVSANFATNKNEVTALDPLVDAAGTGFTSNRPGTITRTGSSIGTYYMPEWAGVNPETGYGMIYEIDQEVFAKTGETVKTGNIIPATQTNMQQNKIIHEGKTGLPTMYGGLSTNMTYKQFDFSLSLSYSLGNYIYNEHATYSLEGAGANVYSDWLDNSWKQPGDIAKYPQARWLSTYEVDGDNSTFGWQAGYPFHDQTLEKADYLRLQNITVGYTLPKKVLDKLTIDYMRFYISGSNLLTLTGYSGWDPEIELSSSGGVKADGLVFRGDSTTPPAIMTFVAGVNLKF